MNNLLRVLYAPSNVFAGIPEAPQWFLPFISALIASCLTSALIINAIGMDNIIRRQLQAQPQLIERLGEEKVEEIAQQANTPARQVITYTGNILMTGVIILAVSGLFTGALVLAGTEARFRNVFLVTAYSFFAYYFVLLLVSGLVLFVTRDRETLDPGNLLLSHAGAFLDPETTNRALFSFATSLDIFTFWLLFLIALGLSKVSKQVTFAHSAAVVVGSWVVYVAFKAGVSLFL